MRITILYRVAPLQEGEDLIQNLMWSLVFVMLETTPRSQTEKKLSNQWSIDRIVQTWFILSPSEISKRFLDHGYKA